MSKKPADRAAAETAVRNAASAFAEAIANAREHALAVEFPTNPEGLPNIAISETGQAKVLTTVIVDPTQPPVDPEALAEAGAQTQAAAAKASEKALAKA